MRLLLARHGEAVEPSIDPLRPLSAAGREDVERVAATVAASGVRVTRVCHSGKNRAEETAAIWAPHVAPDVTLAVDRDLEPDEDPAPVVARIAAWTEDTLLVGHLPSLPRLATRLLRDGAGTPYVTFRPGTVLILERDAHGAWRRIARHDP